MSFQHKNQQDGNDLNPYSSIKSSVRSSVKSSVQPAQLKAKSAKGETNSDTTNSESDTTALPDDVQAKMENSFGTDFSDVNIHSNSQKSDNLNAKAFTQGKDIHFAPGEFQPQTKEGQQLIGHELTHVVQQQQGKVGNAGINGKDMVNSDPALEKEADDAGEKASEGEYVNISNSSALSIQKDNKETPIEMSEWRNSGNLRGNVPVRDEFSVPDSNVIEDFDKYSELYAIAEVLQQKQEERANNLIKDGEVTDFNYWFARVYSLVTKHELDYVKSGAFYYPSYVLRCVIAFEELYAKNLEAVKAGKGESHWKTATDAAAANKTKYDIGSGMQKGSIAVPPLIPTAVASGEAMKVMAVTDSLVKAMLAHIRYDLPRAEAWVYTSHYKSQTPSIETFMQDFMTMGGIFDLAGNEMQGIIANEGSGLADYTPKSAQDMAMRHMYDADMTKERADTWQRAVELSQLPDDKMSPSPFNENMEIDMKDGVSYTSWFDNINSKPSMDDHSPDVVTDSDAILDMKSEDIAAMPLIKRIQMIAQMLNGTTMNDPEDAILRILNATLQYKPGEFVTLIDGVDPYELLLDFDFSQYPVLENILISHYYCEAPSVSIVRLLNSTVIAWVTIDESWEGTVALDALRARTDKEAIVLKMLTYRSGFVKEEDKDKSPLLQALSILSNEVTKTPAQRIELYAMFGITLSSDGTGITEKNTSASANKNTEKTEKQPAVSGITGGTTTGTGTSKNTTGTGSGTNKEEKQANETFSTLGKKEAYSDIEGTSIECKVYHVKTAGVKNNTCTITFNLGFYVGKTYHYISTPITVKATLHDTVWVTESFNVRFKDSNHIMTTFSAPGLHITKDQIK